MKKIVLILIGAVILLGSDGLAAKKEKQSGRSAVTVYTEPELAGLADQLAAGFKAYSPETEINVAQMADNQELKPGGFLLVTDEPGMPLLSKSAMSMVVGRDVVVPVINPKNPYLSQIREKGVSAASLARLFAGEGQVGWGTLLGESQGSSVNFYIYEDLMVNQAVGSFLSLDPSMIRGTSVVGGAGMIEAIQRDPLGIGFCRVNDLTAAGEPLLLLPIDRNANGKLDYIEAIYESSATLMRGVWIGKYPKALTRNIYLVASEQPATAAEAGFVKHILGEGQAVIEMSGLKALVPAERKSRLALFADPALPVKAANPAFATQLIITITALLAIIFLLTFFFLRYKRNHSSQLRMSKMAPAGSITLEGIEAPAGLFFDKSHTWAFMEPNGIVRIGIDDFLQHVTGPLTRIKLKKPGDKVRKGEPVMTLIRNGKHLEIKSPVSGIIREENLLLMTDSSLVNRSPYGKGWIYQIEPTNWMRETQLMLMSDKYREWVRSEFTRLKDFLANALKAYTPEPAAIVLQDGGELKDNVLAELGPEIWEEFQTQFIDKTR
jgi:glycine cleavage system H lipoate-binding protein